MNVSNVMLEGVSVRILILGGEDIWVAAGDVFRKRLMRSRYSIIWPPSSTSSWLRQTDAVQTLQRAQLARTARQQISLYRDTNDWTALCAGLGVEPEGYPHAEQSAEA